MDMEFVWGVFIIVLVVLLLIVYAPKLAAVAAVAGGIALGIGWLLK